MKYNLNETPLIPNNIDNPYGGQVPNLEEGQTRFPAPQSHSTMVSDNVIMAQRLKQFVPKSSVMEGRKPIVPQVTGVDFREEINQGQNYKSIFQ